MFGIRAELQRFGRNIDRFRSEIEHIRADRYLRIPYYERWLDITLRDCEEKGFIAPEERRALETARKAEEIPRFPRTAKPIPAEAAPPAVPGYARPITTPPAFAVGQQVRARNLHSATHTRLPRYVRGRTGTVIADHGGFVFPDSNAIGEGEQPKRLYTVRFAARELWGESAKPRDTISLDLWEPYLEQAV